MPCRVLSGGHTCGLSRNVRQVCQRMGADCRSPFLYHQRVLLSDPGFPRETEATDTQTSQVPADWQYGFYRLRMHRGRPQGKPIRMTEHMDYFHGLALCLARMPDSKKWGLASLQNQCRLRKQKHGRCYRAAILFLYLYVPSPCHKPVLKHSMAVPKQTLRFYPAHRGLHSHDSLHNTNPGPLLRNPKNKAAPHFLEPPCFLLKNC